MHLFLVLLLPLLAACLPARVGHRFGSAAAAWTAAAGTLAALIAALPPLLSVFAGTPVQVGLAWLPQIGLDLFLRLDGLAALFVLLVLGIGLLVVLYARYYLAEGDAHRPLLRPAARCSWGRCSASCSPTTCCCCSSSGS